MRRKPFFSALATAALVVLTLHATAIQARAQTEKVLHSFGSTKDGAYPYAGLVLDAAGNLYGITNEGGVYRNGTVFQLVPTAGPGFTEKILHSFKVHGDASDVAAGLILDPSGNLYGTTLYGGIYGGGTVFELSPAADGTWRETILHDFNIVGGDGSNPHGTLVFDSSGNLYGATLLGGAHAGGDNIGGTVFELSPTAGGHWSEKILHSFNHGSTDGDEPFCNLVFDSSGNLYGTTFLGGAFGGGTAFELRPTTSGRWVEDVLHNFQVDGVDGYAPVAGMIFDASGNLYGTTLVGGAFNGGAVFELTATTGGWNESVLYSFSQNGVDGVSPQASLIFDPSGNLFSTTYSGGTFDGGTVFELTPQTGGGWTESIIHNFGSTGDGKLSVSSLVMDPAGNLYGTTIGGGTFSSGTAFEIKP